eukprot:INCI20234.1.p1 GENE.INCI20234.1~~INCI20234.1.p1  ORF type:complete len:277 (-),score=23.26 INCI20234.1:98-928(-)
MTSNLSPQTHGRPLGPGVPTMLFMSGFPDLHNSFDKVYPQFEETHHVIVCIMPDYDKKHLSRFFGHPFSSIVEALRDLLSEAKECGDITLVGHDWGSYVVQRFAAAHPDMVQRLCVMDVGYGVHAKSLPVILGYQMWLCFAFLISRIPLIGKYIAMILMAVYPWKCFGPTPHEYRMPTKPQHVRMHMCYPYLQLFLGLFCCDKLAAPKFQRDIPTLFVYGQRKRAYFHSQKFLDRLDSIEGSEQHALDCGHWIQTQKPEEFLAILKTWISPTQQKR